MIRQAIVLEMQHALKGEYPQSVPLAEGIDLSTLTEGDDAPMFLTLPIATETTSRNGVKYQSKDVKRIVSAINNREIIGQKGHLTEAERSHRFDTPALFWVGATLDESGVAWGKAYIPRTAQDVREYVRVAKAMNAKIGTSIYGTAEINDLHEIVGDSLMLEQIDLVNPSRVGVPQATGVPIITQESIQTDISESTEEKSMDAKTQPQEEVISEMERNLQVQVSGLTATVRELTLKVDAQLRELTDMKTVKELLKPENGDVILAVRATLSELESLKHENLQLLQTAIAQAIAEKVKAEHVRPIIQSMVVGKNPTRLSEVASAVDAVLALNDVKTLLKNTTVTEMGPAQQRPAMPNGDAEEVFIYIPQV